MDLAVKAIREGEIIELAIRDGFKSPEDFTKWFKRYDLRTPMSFYVYRWDWNETK